MNTPKVLFVCDDSSCSQMAETFLRQLANGTLGVQSTGMTPVSKTPPFVVEVMRELGIELPHQTPKDISELAAISQSYDFIVVIGEEPLMSLIPGNNIVRNRYHWVIPSLSVTGMPCDEQLAHARVVRDKIQVAVKRLCHEIFPPKGLFAW